MNKKKIKWWHVLLAIFVIGLISGLINGGKISNKPIYQNAKEIEFKNGTGDKVLGKYSLIKISQEKCTDEALEDYYFNYVLKSNCNYHIIVYTDKDGYGCHTIKGFVNKDVVVSKDDKGDYIAGDSTNATMYYPEGNKLIKK